MRRPHPRLETTGDVFGHRVLAHVIDNILLSVLFAAMLFAGTAFGELGVSIALIVGLAAVITYFFLLEGFWGYTPGKYLLGLVVVKSDGSDCTVGASIVRNLLWLVDSFPFANLVAVASILLTDDDQRVGDLAADTVVVKRH